MTFYSVLAIYALLLTIITILEGRQTPQGDPPMKNAKTSEFFILICPYIALFYSDHFWNHLLFTVPLLIYGVVLTRIANLRGSLAYHFDALISLMVGSFLLAIILYFLFFHDGALSDSEVSTVAPAEHSNSDEPAESWLPSFLQPIVTYLPYLVFVGLGVHAVYVRMQRKRLTASMENVPNEGLRIPYGHISLVITVPLLTLLPLLTGYYWWMLLAGIILYFQIMSNRIPQMEVSLRGGIGMVSVYLFMGMVMLSIILYAVLF